MKDLPESFNDLCRLDTYLRKYDPVRKFVLDAVSSWRPDIIVTIARKSLRILNTLFGSDKICDIRIIEDGRLTQSEIGGRRIMVFDDSIHTGNSVKACIRDILQLDSPADYRIVSLLCNEPALDELSSHEIPSDKVDVYKLLEDYEKQQQEFADWMFPLIVGAGNKLGREFVSEFIELDCDVEHAGSILFAIFKEFDYSCTDITDGISEHLGNLNLTFDPPGFQDSIDGNECQNPKIRTNLFTGSEGTVLVLEYFATPSDILTGIRDGPCQNRRFHLCEYAEKEERNCLKCTILDFSIRYIRKFHSRIREILDQEGLIIGAPMFRLPAKEKYPPEINLTQDVFQRLQK